MVKTKCYGETREWPSREAAIDFFMAAIVSCEPGSSECCRYVSIFQQLQAGADFATDEP